MTQDPVARFGAFELTIRTGELRKHGVPVPIQEQPLQVLVAFLERPGELVTREELRRRLWPDNTFVDYERGLNAAVNRLRDTLGDSAEAPRFVETIPRRGYRFIAQTERPERAGAGSPPGVTRTGRSRKVWAGVALLVLVVLAAGATWWGMRSRPEQRNQGRRTPSLVRFTFGQGLQLDPTFSPDGSFVAYASDRAGNFDIWVQPVHGGDAVQVTRSQAQDLQPDWSPDGRTLVFRSSAEGGGLFTVPAFGGVVRRLTNFGFRPRYSPDGSEILFVDSLAHESQKVKPGVFVVGPDGGTPRRVFQRFWSTLEWVQALDWHPDGRVSVVGSFVFDTTPFFLTAGLHDAEPHRSRIPTDVVSELKPCSRFSGLRWQPSGRELLFVCQLNERGNVWSVRVDPLTLDWTGHVEHVTFGAENDTALAVARTGELAALSHQTITVRAWAFPLDEATGHVLGEGRPLTPADFSLRGMDLSPDGHTFVFAGTPTGSGEFQVWESSLVSNESRLRVTDERRRGLVRLSRSNSIAYARREETGVFHIVYLKPNDSTEYVLAESPKLMFPFDWSAEGDELIGTGYINGQFQIVLWQLADAPHAERTARTVLRDPRFALWNGRRSPDGKWICLNANGPPRSYIGVAPAEGDVSRPWTRITGEDWSDQPRWSPSGTMLYYVAGLRDWQPNVRAVRFDAQTGRPIGQPIQVTKFDNPARGLPQDIDLGVIAVAKGRLVVPIQEVSGNIWLLKNQ